MRASNVLVEASPSGKVSVEVHCVLERRVDMVEGLQWNPLVKGRL
jgi:hypothetical protein